MKSKFESRLKLLYIGHKVVRTLIPSSIFSPKFKRNIDVPY